MTSSIWTIPVNTQQYCSRIEKYNEQYNRQYCFSYWQQHSEQYQSILINIMTKIDNNIVDNFNDQYWWQYDSILGKSEQCDFIVFWTMWLHAIVNNMSLFCTIWRCVLDSRQYETIFNNINTNIVVYCTKLSVLSDIVSIVPYCLQYCNGLVCRWALSLRWQSRWHAWLGRLAA